LNGNFEKIMHIIDEMHKIVFLNFCAFANRIVYFRTEAIHLFFKIHCIR
jgi:hypothetical protein